MNNAQDSDHPLGSCVLNDAQDFDLAMWSTYVKVDQFANHVFQCAKRAGNGRRSLFFMKRGKTARISERKTRLDAN